MRSADIVIAVWFTLPLTGSFTACEKSPTSPSPAPAPSRSSPSPDSAFSINGVVFNVADRPLAGVRVEVADGPGLGRLAMTDEWGRFALSSVYSDPVLLRLSKDGYVTRTSTLRGPFDPRGVGASFYLELSGLSVSMTGDYTLMFDADPSCTQLPAAARARSYRATIAPRSESDWQRSPNRYDVVLSGANFFRGRAGFFLGIVGDSGRFQFDSDFPFSGLDPYIIEELAPSTYLTIEGETDAVVSGSTISSVFMGYFQYCAGTAEPLRCAEPVSCSSSNHRLTLTRR